METAQEARISRYEILGELGRGAMGVVYKARDPQLDRVVAIKTVHPQGGLRGEPYAELKRRLSQEGTAAARLNHPNIVAIYDVVFAGDVPCIVMEYVEGRTLAELIATGPLHPKKAVQVVLQVCEALDYAHPLGVVHRDIKPANILVADDGTAKLSDFSIARLKGANATQTGVMLGTPAYIAPERIRGRGADARSDLFSLGVVLYEAVTGVSPFQADDLAAVLYQVVHVDPRPPRAWNPAVSPALDAVIRRLMNREPPERYSNARALAQALAGAVDPTKKPVPPAWTVHLRGVGQRAALIGGVCLVVVGGAGGDSDLRREPWGADSVSLSRQLVMAAVPDRPRNDGYDSPPPAHSEATRDERSVPIRPRSPRQLVDRAASGPEAARSRDRIPQGRSSVPPTKLEVPVPGPSPEMTGCVSVNAVPFATVYVDGQSVGETPRACLRIPVGERRVQFQEGENRSPERVIRVTERHTADNPLTLSYDFLARQFREP